ncbi:MAG: SDR family NAD(P)-dependent oxidoreductase [Bacteroidota bacterium]
MKKTIFITGSTDGIGKAAAILLAQEGHSIYLHGRNPQKLEDAIAEVKKESDNGAVDGYLTDLSDLDAVRLLAEKIKTEIPKLDVLINNAGVYSTSNPITKDGLDVRFIVNTIAPYILAQEINPLLGKSGRIINLSSAAQATVNPDALTGKMQLSDGVAYAQSKLAITMWTKYMASVQQENGPVIVAVNPGSMLASKMVREAYGVHGRDISIGSSILVRAALSEEFEHTSGSYFDNDSGQFAPPHRDALNNKKNEELVMKIEELLIKT